MSSGNTRTASGTITRLRALPIAAILLMIFLAGAVSSCEEEKHAMLSGSIDPQRFPTMRTVNVSTLISDSGITRYKITAPLWLMFEEASVPQWKFPKGLHLEKYDDFFRKDATVDCDSATFFKEKQTWRLDGYVRIANMVGEKFLTPQLFWDQRHHKIYSDSFIHIEKSDRIIEGYGFESDERMTNYRVLDVSGIFPVEDFKKSNGGDSTATTTVVRTSGAQMRPPVSGADSTRKSRKPSTATTPTPAPQNNAVVAAPQKAASLKTATQAAPTPAKERRPSRPGSRP